MYVTQVLHNQNVSISCKWLIQGAELENGLQNPSTNFKIIAFQIHPAIQSVTLQSPDLDLLCAYANSKDLLISFSL